MGEITQCRGLPLIQSGHSQKNVTHNAAIECINQLLRPTVESRSVANPPQAPATRQRWIIGAAAMGEWAVKDRRLAAWDSALRRLSSCPAGIVAWNANGATPVAHGITGRNADFLPVGGLLDGVQHLHGGQIGISQPAGGVTADVEARTTLTLLLAHRRVHGILTH